MNTNLPTHPVADSFPQTSLATSPGTRWTYCFLAVVLCGSVVLAAGGSRATIESIVTAKLSAVPVTASAAAAEKWSDDPSFRTVECSRSLPLVSLRSVGELQPSSSWTFVIAHGLGGTMSGDRFCQLAIEIKRTNPVANVLLIDWSSTASETSYGIPRIWHR